MLYSKGEARPQFLRPVGIVQGSDPHTTDLPHGSVVPILSAPGKEVYEDVYFLKAFSSSVSSDDAIKDNG